MHLGPDYETPEPPVTVPETFQNAPQDKKPLPVPEDSWWQVFDDPKIDSLVETVLAHNLDLRKAVARVLEVRSQFRQVQADRWPTVSVEARGSRTRQTTTSPVTGQTSTGTTDVYSLAFPATFEWDLWGRLARAAEGAQAELLAAEENRNVVAQTVVAEAVSLYLQMVSLEREITVTGLIIEALEDNLNLVTRRYNKGLTSILDVRQARRSLAQAEAGLPLLHLELGNVQQRLSVLAGQYPRTRPAKADQEEVYEELAPVPPGLPSDLLQRRPDIRVAEARLRSLNAQVGVAYANRFPRITLTGRFGYTSDELSNFFNGTNELWNLAAGITQPIFDYGKRKAGYEAAQARFTQGQIDYARTVLSAFADTENALLVREQQLQRRQRFLLFLQEARATQQTAQQRYERGLSGYLSVLEAQQVRFRAELDLIRVERTIYQNRVALHRALGGSWATEPTQMQEAMLSGQAKATQK